MSKKNKKNQQKNNELLPAKNQLKFLSDTLDKNHMDSTNFLFFLPDDFKNIFSRSKEDENTLIMAKIRSDLKNLLISPFINFWSTCSYNVYFQKCIESFLKCARKPKHNNHTSFSELLEKKAPQKEQHEQNYAEIMKEIYRLIFMIVGRIALSLEESELSKEFNCTKIIYDNWLLDIPKIMDFIAIYGGIEANKPILRKIVMTTLNGNNDFKEDFIHCINLMKRLILERKLNDLNDLKKRDKLVNDIKMDAKEIENRYLLLLSLLDATYVINDVFVFYPNSCIQCVILDDKMFFYIENIYYELEAAKENWRLNELKERFVPLMNQIMNNCVQAFISFFKFFSDSILNNFLHDKNSIKFAAKLENSIIGFGKMYFFNKKENENLSILKQMLRKNYDISVLLNNLPVFLQFSNENQEKLFIFLAKIESLKDAMAKENIQQEEIVIEEGDEVETDNEEDNEQSENKGENDDELKNEVSEIKEKIKIEEVIISKKEKNFALDEAERKEMAKFIRDKLEDEYDDEYDDTFDIFQGNRKERVEHNNLDPDSDRDDKIENNPNLYNEDQNNDYFSSATAKSLPQREKIDQSEKVVYVPKEEQNMAKKVEHGEPQMKPYQETKYEEKRYEQKRYEPKRYDDRRQTERRYEEKRYEEKRYNDKNYDDKKYEERRYDDKKYDDKRYEERGGDEKTYQERRGDEKRYEEKRYDERRYDERRYDERRYEGKRYEERRHDDHGYEQRNSDYQSGYNNNRNYNKYEPKGEEEEQIREENRYANKNYHGYGQRNEEGSRQGDRDSYGNKRDPYATKKQHQYNQDKYHRDRAQYKRKY